jgi:hypothetical protein
MPGDGESRTRTDVCHGHELDGYVPDKRVYKSLAWCKTQRQSVSPENVKSEKNDLIMLSKNSVEVLA